MDNSAQERRDRRIPYYFVGFFLVLFVLEGVFVGIAVTTHRGVVTENAYEKGVAYNAILDAAAHQAALGWSGTVVYNSGQLQFSLQDRAAQAIVADKVRAYFTRPTQDGYDFSRDLPHVGAGHYRARIRPPLPGLWRVQVAVRSGEEQWQMGTELVIR